MNQMMVNEEAWTFNISEWITHKDQPMPSLVMGRLRTTRGDEIYAVRSFAFDDPNRDRMILGEALRPIDDEAWGVCIAAGTWLDSRIAA